MPGEVITHVPQPLYRHSEPGQVDISEPVPDGGADCQVDAQRRAGRRVSAVLVIVHAAYPGGAFTHYTDIGNAGAGILRGHIAAVLGINEVAHCQQH